MVTVAPDDDVERRLEALFARGDFGAARVLAGEWLGRLPADPIAHLWWAQAAAEMGDLDGAENGFMDAIRLRRDLAPAWVNLGMVRARRGKFDSAVEALLEARPLMQARPDAEKANFLAMLDQSFEGALGARDTDSRWHPTRPAPAVSPLARDSLISIIIPTCDRPGLLKEAVESALAQTYAHLEVIVVNDGSGSVAAHLPRDPRLGLVEDGKKRGQAAARNLGVRRARGTVLFFLDDDDLYLARHVEHLIECLLETRALFAYSDSRAVFEKIDGGIRHVLTRGEPFPGVGFSRARLHVHNHIPIIGWAVRRPIFDLLGGFDESMESAEDWDLSLRASDFCDFAYLPEAGGEARIRAQTNDSVSKTHAVSAYLPRIYGRFADRGDPLVVAARQRYAERVSS